MHMEMILRWLAMMAWASTDEIAALLGTHRTTAGRGLSDLLRKGLVGRRTVGRSVRPRTRWLLTSEGVEAVYPDHHPHPGPDDLHTHDPGYADDHGHPSYWNGLAGASVLYSRMEIVEVLYPLAIKLFWGQGGSWHCDGGPLQLTGWRWLRGGRLVEAVATYERGVNVLVCWVGRELTESMLRWRWEHRFDRLVVVPCREKPYGGFDPWDYRIRLDPYEDVLPSAYAIVCADPGSYLLARRVLSLYNDIELHGWVWAYGSGQGVRSYQGNAGPAFDDIWDAASTVIVGYPEDLCHKDDDE